MDGPTPQSEEFSWTDYVRRTLPDARELLREDLTPDGRPSDNNSPGTKVTVVTPQWPRLQRLLDILPRQDEILCFFPPF